MTRILIVGGGVIGMCAAWYCRQAGHQVQVIEHGPPGRDCCSLGNAGLIVPSHIVPLAAPGMVSMGLRMMWNPESPFYIKPRLNRELIDWGIKFMRACRPEHVERSAPLLLQLNLASKRLFEEFASLTETDFGLVKKGCLNLCKTGQRLEHEKQLAAMSHKLGMPAHVLDADETRRLDPGIDLDIFGSVYFPEDAHLSPNRFMQELERLLVKAEVQIRWGTKVHSFQRTGERITGLRTDTGTLEGDEYILAGGAWSSQLGHELGLRLPMQAGKGYSLTIEKPRQLPQLSYICTEARLAVTPMLGALRFGGTMEIAGLDLSINTSRIRGIAGSVGKYFPAFPPESFDRIKPWAGLRPCSPDGLPYIGRTTRYKNLSIGTGHAMMGLSLGPITGKLLAEVITGAKPSVDLKLLHPDRYG